MKHIIQKNINECGIACICMLLEHDFGVDIDYFEVKNKIKIFEKGIKLDDLVEYLSNYDKYKAYECNLENLPNFPFITMINLKNKYNHYIVVWRKDNKYIYYSNPATAQPTKILLKRFKKIYSGVIVYFKECEIKELIINHKIKIAGIKKYAFPLAFLNIVEFIVFMFSLVYLFNINEFNVLKIVFFFAVLTVQIIIYLLKNNIINRINRIYEANLVNHLIVKNNNCILIKENIKKAYYLMNRKNIFYNKIIPYFIISLFAGVLCFYIHYLLFVCILIFGWMFYIIEFVFSRKKLKYSSQCAILEEEFNNANYDLEDKLKKLKKALNKLAKINMSETIVSLFYRQVLLVFIMLFFSLINQEYYVFIGVYLLFYLFDGIGVFAEYNSEKQRYRYVVHSYIQDANKK